MTLNEIFEEVSLIADLQHERIVKDAILLAEQNKKDKLIVEMQLAHLEIKTRRAADENGGVYYSNSYYKGSISHTHSVSDYR